jgi:hypothetical protein
VEGYISEGQGEDSIFCYVRLAFFLLSALYFSFRINLSY